MRQQTHRHKRLAAWLAGLAASGFGWAVLLWLTHGIRVTIAGVHISSRDPLRPLLFGMLALTGALACGGAEWVSSTARALRHGGPRSLGSPGGPGQAVRVHAGANAAALLLAASTMCVSLAFNTWTASGADSFGYVSQAALWRSGHLDFPVALARDAPWPNAVRTFAPLAYRPAPGNAPAVVPVMFPGVPLLMALLQSVVGHCGAFLVTPLAGAALVWLTFAIGRRAHSAAAGLVAAWLVATSPVVLFMLMWPMSDVPIAALAALTAWLLARRTGPSSIGAGLAASAGLLTRSTFAPIAAAGAVWLVLDAAGTRGRGRWRWIAGYLVALLPGAALLARLNVRWYGAPMASGYGTFGDLFALTNLPVNIVRYAGWITETSPLAWVGLAAMAMPIRRLWNGPAGPHFAWLSVMAVGGTCGLYLVYEPFNAWWFLRFLLPAWPFVFVGVGVVALEASRHGLLARVLALAAVLLAGAWGIRLAEARGVFDFGEERYVSVARAVASVTEPTAVIVTGEHSGTLRYYAGRETLRQEYLDPAWLDRAVAWLAARGHHPYILLEDWERARFEARFGRTNRSADLSVPPTLEWESATVPGVVWLYDPLRRTGQTVHPGIEFERGQPRCAPPVGFPPPRRP